MGEMGAFLAKKKKKNAEKKNGGALCGIEPYCLASGCFNQQAIVWLLKSKMTQIAAPVMMPLSERRGWGVGGRGSVRAETKEKKNEKKGTHHEKRNKRCGWEKKKGVRERPRRQISPLPSPPPAVFIWASFRSRCRHLRPLREPGSDAGVYGNLNKLVREERWREGEDGGRDSRW